MPRAATTTDVFNAIAEPRRRQIIAFLAGRKATAVGDMVVILALPQPTISKHLGVLRKVGVVSVAKKGQQRMYELNAAALKPLHDWTGTFEKYWDRQLDRIKQRAERKALNEARRKDSSSN